MIDFSPASLIILMFLSLIVLLTTGFPLAFVLAGIATIFGLLAWGFNCLSIFVNIAYGVMDNFVLMAIPLFIFMAQLLSRSGVSDGLFNAFHYLLGPLRGGLGVAVIAFCVVFAACTGVVAASIITMGLMGMPIMLKSGYDKKLVAGIICSGGSLGILIPPSIMLVLMGSETGISVGRLFAGAVIPGLILSAFYVGYILIISFIRPELAPALSLEERRKVSNSQLIKMFLVSIVPPALLITGVLGTIFTGTATATEAAGLGAAVALLLMIVYGKFSWRDLYQAAIDTTKTTAMALMIVVGAGCYSAIFLGIGGGNVISEFILGLGVGKWGILAITWLIYFILGMFIDWIAIVMITFPVFLPIVEQIGFDKFWYVMSIAILLQTSFLTPPFGYALFFLRSVAPPDVSTEDIWKGIVPFVVLMLIGLVVSTLIFPESITWLPAAIVG